MGEQLVGHADQERMSEGSAQHAGMGPADAASPEAQVRKPRRIYPKNITVLMGTDAALSGGLKEVLSGGDLKRFWVTNWRDEKDRFTWTLEVPEEGDYSVAMIIKDESRTGLVARNPDECEIELAAGEAKVTHAVKRLPYWDRQTFAGVLHLPAGHSALTLRALRMPPAARLSLFSLELALPGVKSDLEQSAKDLRASTDWMVQAKYGVMFHWTARSQPRTGPAKPYAEAVRDFNLPAFVKMVEQTGAGFVVFTTSWADYYFPGPIKAIDEILPGRTAERDLVGELADALGRRGIKLLLYYHPGHDDTPWWSRTGFEKEGKTEFFKKWCHIISAIGEHYGTKLAGWWFDDGIATYYPYSAPWEKMTRAAKAGNPHRIIGYNAWILPKATDFQDFACGESDFTSFIGKDFLPRGGTGRFTGGPQEGLQAMLTTQMEVGNWCHFMPDSEIPPPKFTGEELISHMRACLARRIVSLINLELYQDGTAGAASVEMLEAVHQALQSVKDSPEEIQDDLQTSPTEPQIGDLLFESVDGLLLGNYVTYVLWGDRIMCWGNPENLVKWSFTAPTSGKYRVIVTCAHGYGPSEYVVSVNNQKLTSKVPPSTELNWVELVDDVLGTVELVKDTPYDVTIHAEATPGQDPLHLHRIILRPVKEGNP